MAGMADVALANAHARSNRSFAQWRLLGAVLAALACGLFWIGLLTMSGWAFGVSLSTPVILGIGTLIATFAAVIVQAMPASDDADTL